MEQLVAALLEVCHHNSQLSYHLWVLVFPIVWATLSDDKNKQIHLAKPIIALLSKEYHDRQAHMRPNVVQVDRSPSLRLFCACFHELSFLLYFREWEPAEWERNTALPLCHRHCWRESH